jgi:hypothetical protein
MTDPARRALLVAAAALPAACAAPGANAPSVPVATHVLRVGDRWRYQLINRFRNQWLGAPVWELTAIEPELRLKVTNLKGGSVLEERWADAWRVREELIFGIPMVYAEPQALVPSPAEAGRTLITATTYREAGGGEARPWRQRLSAGPWETIEVPAGRFECLRISRFVAFTHPDSFRSASTRSETLWYAPAAGRWVQREWRGEYVSLGQGDGNPAEGLTAPEDWQMLQLTDWQPASRAG